VKCYGIPIFQNNENSIVNIGNFCTFVSSQNINLYANRRCAVSAMQNAVIKIGDHCGFTSTVIRAETSIEIGNNVLCGPNCTIMDSDGHPLNYDERNISKNPDSQPIIISDDVWLGQNVTVLKGCTIGARTVVSGNSTVSHSLPPDVLAGGIPARILKKLK